MFLNTQASIKLARSVHRAYGSWDAARKAGAVRSAHYRSAEQSEAARVRPD